MHFIRLNIFVYFVLIFFICMERAQASNSLRSSFGETQNVENFSKKRKVDTKCFMKDGQDEVKTDAFFTRFPLLIVNEVLNLLSKKDKIECLILNKQIKKRIEGLVYKSIKAPLFQDGIKINNFTNFIKQKASYIKEVDFSVFVNSFVKEEKSKRDLCEEKLRVLWESLPETLIKLKYTEKNDKNTNISSYLSKISFKNIFENKQISHVELSLIEWSPFVDRCMDYEPEGSAIINFIPNNTLTYCSFHGELLEECRRATIFDLALLSQKLSEIKPSFISLTYLSLDKEDILTAETPVAPNNKLKGLFIKNLFVENKNPTFDFFKNFKHLEKLTIEQIIIEDSITFLFNDLKNFNYKSLESKSTPKPSLFLFNKSPHPINILLEN